MIDWEEKYMREVEGLNNEGDPIGGGSPSGLRHAYEALKAEFAEYEEVACALAKSSKEKFEALQKENAEQAKRIALLEYDVKHLKDALRAYGDEDIDDDED